MSASFCKPASKRHDGNYRLAARFSEAAHTAKKKPPHGEGFEWLPNLDSNQRPAD